MKIRYNTWKHEAIKRKNIEVIIHEDELVQFRTIWERVSHVEHYQKKTKCRNKAGETLRLIASFSPVRDKNGSINKIIFNGMDHTASESEKLKLQEQTTG